jgi:L-lactate dehydrogenase
VKVGVIGMGRVGSSVAVSILQMGVATELLVTDVAPAHAEGEAMDLAHGASFYPAAKVRCGSIEEMGDADAIVISAGRGGTASQSRLELVRSNGATVRSIAARLAGMRGILVVVTNPVDVMTYVAASASRLPNARVIGTGTMLDTARLRQVLGRELNIDPRAIHAHVVGEHGDSEVVLWSKATVGRVALRHWPGWTGEKEPAIVDEVRTAAYEIIARKGATNHAIGLVTAALLRWILRGERRVLTVSRVQEGAMGIRDLAISLPAVVGRGGATDVIDPDMNADERAAFDRSADVLRGATAAL